MSAKQTFKNAFSVARSMRDKAVGQAEFSAAHGRFFTSWRFMEEVRRSAGVFAGCAVVAEFRAATAAAEVLAEGLARAARPTPSLTERLAAIKAAEVYDFASDY